MKDTPAYHAGWRNPYLAKSWVVSINSRAICGNCGCNGKVVYMLPKTGLPCVAPSAIYTRGGDIPCAYGKTTNPAPFKQAWRAGEILKHPLSSFIPTNPKSGKEYNFVHESSCKTTHKDKRGPTACTSCPANAPHFTILDPKTNTGTCTSVACPFCKPRACCGDNHKVSRAPAACTALTRCVPVLLALCGQHRKHGRCMCSNE